MYMIVTSQSMEMWFLYSWK